MENFGQLRKVLLASSDTGQDERVEVNQRHLIDKILARYSAENTIYREVLQNANDAGATEVEIIYETDCNESKGSSTLLSITLRNNGRSFTVDDWNRLKKIAEGNPDEQKIGFFGVGFYSLFSVCEEPLVISGGTCLAFHWDKDQLLVRTAKSPENFDPKWTSIYLSLRSPLEFPNLDEMAHFFTKSLLFTTCLQIIRVKNVTNNLYFEIAKKRAEPTELHQKPQSLLSSLTSKPNGLFTIKEVKKQAVQVDLDKRFSSVSPKAERSLLSNIWSMAKNALKDKEVKEMEKAAMEPGKFSIFLHIIECTLKVSVNSTFASSMERIMKKKPSSSAKLLLLFSTFDEISASTLHSTIKHPILSDILPATSQGKVYIGFETHQTTGCGVHLAGPFIPTVERESLDFVDKTLATWNEDLFRTGAKVMRLLFEIEISCLKRLYEHSTLDEDYWNRCNHVLSCFAFDESSPSPIPSYLEFEEFMKCSDISQMLLPSSKGIVPLHDLRTLPLEMSQFVIDIPTLSYELLNPKSRKFIDRVKSLYEIPNATVNEIMASLKDKRLELDQLTSCLNWIISLHKSSSFGIRSFYSMISNLLVPTGNATGDYSLLSTVSHYPSSFLRYEMHIALPSTCLSSSLAERFASYELESIFNLNPLSVADWLLHLSINGIISTKEKSENALVLINKNWHKLDESEKVSIASILSTMPVIPTKDGLRIPRECYLENVKLFGDVSTIDFPKRYNISDDFLIAIGVNTHIEVSQIFSLLDQLNWNHRKLIKYMLSIEEQLSEDELKKLSCAKIFPSLSDSDLHHLSDLYIDEPVTRLLKLPILAWKDIIGVPANGEITRFLARAGFNTLISWEFLLEHISLVEPQNSYILYDYFVDHFRGDYQRSYSPTKVQFPCIRTKKGTFVKPMEVFVDEHLEILGFLVIEPKFAPYASFFKLANRPPSFEIVDRMRKIPLETNDFIKLTSYLSDNLSMFSKQELSSLSKLSFIPFNDQWICPTDVFLSLGRFKKEMFPVIEIPESSRPFLRACGVKDEPHVDYIVSWICEKPTYVLEKFGADHYMELLKWISVQIMALNSEIKYLLSSTKCLLALEFRKQDSEQDELLDACFVLEYAKNIYLIDDSLSQQLFGVLSVPADPVLEDFYTRLGSLKLSQCVKTTWKFMGIPQKNHETESMKELIRLRAPLLISDQQSTTYKPSQHALSKLKDIETGMVDKIIILRTLNSVPKEQATTACLHDKNILLITKGVDYFDVAIVLSQIIYGGSSRLSDTLLICTLVSSSISSLRAKGFAVDRILTQKPIIDVRREESAESPRENINHLPKEVSQRDTTLTDAYPKDTARPIPPSQKTGIMSSIKAAMGSIINSSPSSLKPPNSHDQRIMSNSLRHSIKMLRSNREKFFNVSQPNKVEKSRDQIAPQLFCSTPTSTLLQHSIVNDIPVFIASSIQPDHIDLLLDDGNEDLVQFSMLLEDIGNVFEMSKKTLHIFVDPESRIIAFNRANSLFFNFSHQLRLLDGEFGETEIKSSWFMTFCHELAHNFVTEHDERHEYYMSCFAEMYLGKFSNQLL